MKRKSIENDEIISQYSTHENWLPAEDLSKMLGISSDSVCHIRARLEIKLICPNCKNEFNYGYTKACNRRRTNIHKDPKFCSYECWKEYMKKEFSKECPVCHKSFTGSSYFCSNKCKNVEKKRFEEIRIKTAIDKHRKICPECGIEFIKNQGHQIFCSKLCRIKHHKLKTIKGICKQCGEEFFYGGTEVKNFCSNKCWGIYASKESAKQGNFNFTGRTFAYFILTLRKSNRAAYLKTLDEIKHTLDDGEYELFYNKFHRVLAKFQISFNGKSFRKEMNYNGLWTKVLANPHTLSVRKYREGVKNRAELMRHLEVIKHYVK